MAIKSATAAPTFAPTPERPERPNRPVLTWAAVGAGFILLQLYVFTTWITTGEATPTARGSDPVPGSTMAWIWILTSASIAVCIFTIWYFVRGCRRERRLTFDAVLLIGWLSVAWQDPLMNYARPILFYNSAMPNLGSWVERVPGWMSPNGSNLAEPVVLNPTCYVWFTLVGLLACVFMQKAKARWPGLGKTGTFLAALAAICVVDVIIELAFIRAGIWGYSGVVHGLSIWGGKTYQFPLYEAILWGGVWTAAGGLRYFRDDKGRSVVERGIDEVPTTPRRAAILRTCAVCGFMNVVMLFGYNLPWVWFGMHADQTPNYPSYLRNGLCGPGTAYECPSPHTPIYLPESKGTNPRP